MTLDSTIGRPGMRVVGGESANLSEDRPPRLLEQLLASASDRGNPPTERVVFLARFARVLNDLLVSGAPPGGPEILHTLHAEHGRLLHDEVLPALRERGLTIVQWQQVSAAERNRLRTIFHEVIYPLATPLVVDSAHPFPQLAGTPLNIGLFVRDHLQPRERFACVPLPGRLFGAGLLNGGFVRMSAGRLIGVEMVVCALLEGLFHGMHVLEKSSFRVMSRAGPSVRSVAGVGRSTTCLEVEETTSKRMLNLLVSNLDVGTDGVYRQRSPLALAERIVRVSGARGGRPGRHPAGQIAAATAESNTQ